MDMKSDLLEELDQIEQLILEFQSEYEDDSDFENNPESNSYFSPRPSKEEVYDYEKLLSLKKIKLKELKDSKK